MGKHAILIIAHNEFDILEKTIRLLDDKDNDIYLHIDKKVKFDFNYFKSIPRKSNLFFTKRIKVKWGSISQIKCEYLLFKAAYNKHYDYYHLISGVDMPLVAPQKMHDFFEINKGKEFVNIDNHNEISRVSLERVSLYHFLVSWARSTNKFKRNFFEKFHFRSLRLQRKLNINRLKKEKVIFRKGANWVSITDDFLKYVLSKEKWVLKVFRYSFCADELFIQTILYNSDFYKNICSLKNDDYFSLKRYIDWKRGAPYTFRLRDYDDIVNSKCFFARKFSTKVDDKIVQKIYEKGMSERGES